MPTTLPTLVGSGETGEADMALKAPTGHRPCPCSSGQEHRSPLQRGLVLLRVLLRVALRGIFLRVLIVLVVILAGGGWAGEVCRCLFLDERTGSHGTSPSLTGPSRRPLRSYLPSAAAIAAPALGRSDRHPGPTGVPQAARAPRPRRAGSGFSLRQLQALVVRLVLHGTGLRPEAKSGAARPGAARYPHLPPAGSCHAVSSALPPPAPPCPVPSRLIPRVPPPPVSRPAAPPPPPPPSPWRPRPAAPGSAGQSGQATHAPWRLGGAPPRPAPPRRDGISGCGRGAAPPSCGATREPEGAEGPSADPAAAMVRKGLVLRGQRGARSSPRGSLWARPARPPGLCAGRHWNPRPGGTERGATDPGSGRGPWGRRGHSTFSLVTRSPGACSARPHACSKMLSGCQV